MCVRDPVAHLNIAIGRVAYANEWVLESWVSRELSSKSIGGLSLKRQHLRNDVPQV
jgi:hypothetical protein